MVRVLQTLALPLGHDAERRENERAMGFEPTTFSLARRRTTTVLRPHSATFAESAETQNRTVDTAIFSRVLYQLSYLGDILLLSVRILHWERGIVKQQSGKRSERDGV